MEIKEWNAQSFYALYRNIKEQLLQHCIWVLPYMCHSKDCDSELGFVCDDEFSNNDADLPIELQNAVPVWSTIMYNALKHEKVLPTAAKTILKICGRCGYSFLCRSCVMFHPNLVTVPITLSPNHPVQGSMTYDDYVLAAEFHYDMQGLIANHQFGFDDNNIQDTFISHLNQSDEIQKLVTHDCASTVKSIKDSYSATMFTHTISGLVEQVQSNRCSSGATSSSASLNFSSRPQSSVLLSRPRAFRPRAANAVYDDDDDYDRLCFGNADAYRNYTDSVNELNFLADNLQPADPGSLWTYAVYGIDLSDVPFDDTYALQNAVQHLANDFSTGSRESFDQIKLCAICGEVGHNFFGFPQFQDNDKVKRIFNYRLLLTGFSSPLPSFMILTILVC